jgi:hypothetical protein
MADADDADGDDSMSPVMKRLAVLGLMALTLGACDYGLLLTPDPADPGDTITVTNGPDGPTCFEPLVDPKSAHAAIEQSVPVGIFVMTSILDIIGPEPHPAEIVETDDEGFFTAEIPAPDIPGQHIVFAVCDFSDEVPIDEVLQDAGAAAEPVDDDGVIVDELIVTQQPLSIALSDTQVEKGDGVVATFNRCKDENDYAFGELNVGSAAIPTDEELATDFPDLVVTLDGQPVATIAGTERYRTGTVDVPVTLTEVGEHQIKGVCTYQTFRFGLEELVELFNDSGEPLPLLQGVSAAAEDDIYPYPEEGSEEAIFGQWDEATTEAAGTVTVLAVDDAAVPAPAEPAQVQPSFAG